MPDDLKPFTALVVDDSERDRKDAIDKINHFCFNFGKGLGYGQNPNILEAETPEEGLVLLKKHPDMVFLDINFDPSNYKDISGIDKFLVPTRNQKNMVPIVCRSSDKNYRWTSIENGADAFVNKDDNTNLPYAIRAVLGYRKVMDL